MSINKKYNHYLISAMIVYKLDEEGPVGMMPTNSAVFDDPADKLIRLKLIAKAQQAAQLAFIRKLNDIHVQIKDVVINNMIFLGTMTQEEFNKAPPGTEMVEMEKVSND